MPRFSCGRRCARIIAIVVGVGAVAAAGISIVQIIEMHAALRGFVWPLSVAAASLCLVLAALALTGALAHPAAWLVIIVAGTVQVLGDYETENLYLPALAAAVVALFLAYRWSGARLGTLSRPRSALLALALVSALLGIGQMQVPTEVLNWDRVRRDGGIQVNTFVSEPPCVPPSAVDVSLVDQGCDVVIPARRAWFVVGYATAAMLLGAAAVAGAVAGAGRAGGFSRPGGALRRGRGARRRGGTSRRVPAP